MNTSEEATHSLETGDGEGGERAESTVSAFASPTDRGRRRFKCFWR